MQRTLILLLLLSACGDKDTTATPSSDTGAAPDTDTDTDTGAAAPDEDGDGAPADVDCDDGDPTVYPGAEERCNGTDDDCDGSIAGEEDADGDAALDCEACAGAGFWPAAQAVTDDETLTAAFSAWMGGTACRSYSDARDQLFGTLDRADGMVECVYTGALYPHDPEAPDWKTVNTEHVWPRSDGADREPVECDLHHLFPADALINNYRASLPFGVVVDEDGASGGSRWGTDASGADVFEPRDERKGDIARAILYIAARYPSKVDLQAQRSDAQLALFQAWHRADPPDPEEIARTNLIAAQQGDPNPFVLCPDLAGQL